MRNKQRGQVKQINDLNNLSKEELINIIVSQYYAKSSHNKIEIVDFIVETTESLSVCEQTINRLIDKHKGFAHFRKVKANIDNSIYNNLGIG